jgi:hypothetical protein
MFAIATQALLLTSGLGKELAIQGTITTKALTAPMGMRNIAKKRAPMDVVAVAIALPIAAMSIKAAIWRERSLVLDA